MGLIIKALTSKDGKVEVRAARLGVAMTFTRPQTAITDIVLLQSLSSW